MKNGVAQIFQALFRIFLSKGVLRSAAELSYYLVLSLFPLLICIHGMLGSLQISEERLLLLGSGIVPKEALSVIGSYLAYVREQSSPLLIGMGVVLTATTSSAAFRSIMHIFAEIQGESRYKGFRALTVSVLMSLLFLLVIYFSGFLLLAGDWVIKLLEGTVHIWLRETALRIFAWLRFVLIFFLMYAVIFGIYTFTAPREKEKVPRGVGAFLAAAVIVAVSVLFSFIVSTSVKYTLLYGSLAAFVIILVWMYICGAILIMGDVLNIVLHRYKRNALQNGVV